MFDRNVAVINNSRCSYKLYSVVGVFLVSIFVTFTIIYNCFKSSTLLYTFNENDVALYAPYLPSPKLKVNTNDVYAVMFDAGSTGSRIHVLHFVEDQTANSHLRLVASVFEQVKPGLSSFAENATESLDGLKYLLAIALDTVPKNKWEDTMIALKATAGLRLLPSTQAQALLDEAYHLFLSSPFRVRQQDVSIMDGISEGMFLWFTVNFLRGTFFDDSSSPVGSIDLGGGSCQVAFVPQNQDTILSSPKGHIEDINIFGKKIKLYVHSYLGLGLQSARLAMMGGKETKDETENLFHALSSPCLPLHHEEEWAFGGVEYTARGAEPTRRRYEECYHIAQDVLGYQVHQPIELQDQIVYAFSYVVDKIEESGFLEIDEPQQIKVQDIDLIAQRGTHGFGYHDNSVLVLQKKIEDIEVSWALGAAVHLLRGDDISSSVEEMPSG
uniref:Ectonucleoside triphosphate diphosphohydrolase 5-like n=1 Tax=Saccoglossus kowalevskii TaxID=10224 RepID=A0ABM0GYW5_SACKO|nr:PREDICTED: ectonucleoside triphosphate diphosphohydrolase 5-like [Saccoglossus kowalevskii]